MDERETGGERETGDERGPRDDRDGPPTEAVLPEGFVPIPDRNRFTAVTEAARRLLDELLDHYEVTRVDGIDLDDDAAPSWPGSPAVRLDPAGGGAPVVVTFTPFPGVHLRYGHDGHTVFPRCGCAECDEDPAEEAQDLVDEVLDVVAGGLTESRTRRRFRADHYETRLVSRDGSQLSRQWGTDPPDRPVPVGITYWVPWPRRS